jgi:uncharacterized lipoprotein YmbA
MKIDSWNRFSVAAILVCSFAACVKVNIDQRPNLERRYFALDVDGKRFETRGNSSGVLKLSPVRVAQPYDSKGFVYRIAPGSFETDFYNQFLAAPGPMLTDELRQALSRTNLFEAVINSNSLIEPTHLLEGTVDELYGDFSGEDPGKAVLGMSFTMRDLGSDRPVILRKQYQKTIPLQARSPEALVQGWNRGLEEIFGALISDLQDSGKRSDPVASGAPETR